MTETTEITPIDAIEPLILNMRGTRVILDVDLARLFGTTTKRLNEQVRRNRERFPEDFAFKLTKMEKMEVVANCDHLENIKYSNTLPLAFTEYGAIMAANVLNSQRAVKVSVLVVRAFVRLKKLLSANAELALELADLKNRVEGHDDEIERIVAAIRMLTEPRVSRRCKIGFGSEPDDHKK
ncbi:MAG: ORF6N domain-containing protein [Deltaproteobacteria bacterium]|nr:ORF6N domain-containing protein [Deltaproteobacteria bacterium]